MPSSRGSITSSGEKQRRRKSPVSMYRTDLVEPKSPRPLVRLEPKTPARSKSPSTTLSGYSSSRTPSLSASSQRSLASTSTGASSTSGSSRTRISASFSRLFGKQQKPNAFPPAIIEPPDTPTHASFHPSPEPTANTDTVQSHDTAKPSDEIGDDNEIMEVLRFRPPADSIGSLPGSRRASLALSTSMSDVPTLVLPERRPLSPDFFPSPSRPARDPRRPKTAPSRSSSRADTPLGSLASRVTFAPKPHASPPPVSVSGNLNDPISLRPATSHSEIHSKLDTRGVESLESSMKRSTSLSHSMMMVPPRPDSPFLESTAPAPTSESYFTVINALRANPKKPSSPSLTVGRRERGQGWSGEWNRGDMQDVIQQLRQLK